MKKVLMLCFILLILVNSVTIAEARDRHSDSYIVDNNLSSVEIRVVEWTPISNPKIKCVMSITNVKGSYSTGTACYEKKR